MGRFHLLLHLFLPALGVLVAYDWLVCYLLQESDKKYKEQLAMGKVRLLLYYLSEVSQRN